MRITPGPKPPAAAGVKVIGKPTAYKIVANPLPEDSYHKRLKRSPHFRKSLEELAAAPRGSVLCFESTRCIAQISKASAKLGYQVLFAERDGKLYVQILDTGDDK